MLLCIRKLVAWLLSGQQVPQHIAFIMDGNRRFADQLNIQRIDGHRQGYIKMKQMVQWCLELGVRCVSVYAFSIDNFKRPAAEVDALMDLAAAKFEELLHDEDAKQWRAELRVIGDLSLAPPALQAAAARLMQGSREAAGGCARAVVNICFPYTSSQELQAAVDRLSNGVNASELLQHDITPSLLQRVMHTQDCPPVDLLVRTSGEQRLSDFLLWQSSHALLYWDKCLWPEFGYAQLLRAIMAWQAAAPQLEALRTAAQKGLKGLEETQQQELLLAGSYSGSGAASPPVAAAAAAAAAGGWSKQQQQQQDTQVLDQLQRSSEVLLQLQKQQQQQQQWWGGLLFTSSNGSNGSSSMYAAPAGRSPERASSTSLSVISEDEATHVPHPSQPLRLEMWLRRLEDEQDQHLQQAAAAAAVAG